MTTILDEIAEKFKGYEKAIDEFSRKILNSQKYKNILRDYNIANLEAGIRPDGSDISKIPSGHQKNTGYEPRTIQKKQAKGQDYDHVNLYDFGELYAKLKVVSGSDTLYFYDSDAKYPKLVTIWGEVLGVTQDQVEEFMQILNDDFEEFNRKYWS